MSKKILVNASNLHAGGGVQVAASFISEVFYLLLSGELKEPISIICSTIVNNNLPDEIDRSLFLSFEVLDVYGVRQVEPHKRELFDGYDVCFTVFGPFYFKVNCKKHICGFAQPWIAYPNNKVYPILSVSSYFKCKVKFWMQSALFRRYETLVVEQYHVKNALVKLGYDAEKIKVVSNCVSSVFYDKTSWKNIGFRNEKTNKKITLGFIGRSYIHKNISILKDVNSILKYRFGMDCDFLFTLTESEMELCDFTNEPDFYSVGEISTQQCPNFYKMLDALIFPSLLECFSASPIEAMKMNTTVIASNLPFVKEVCRDAAFYFDPLCPDSIAEVIFNAFSDWELRKEKLELGYKLVENLPSAKIRAESYLKILNSI